MDLLLREDLRRLRLIDKKADEFSALPPTSTIMGSGIIGSPSTIPIPVFESISKASKNMFFLKSV